MRLDTPQDGADAGQQFPRAERLCDGVVRPEPQPDNPVDLVKTLSSKDDNRHIGMAPELEEQSEAVFLPQSQIQDNEVDDALGENVGHRFAVAGCTDAEVMDA